MDYARQARKGQLSAISCNSFSADTLVTTAEGDVPIVDIAIGDEVMAYDEDTGLVGEYTVTDTISHTDDTIVTLVIDGDSIETPPNHLFYTSEGWVTVSALALGDEVLSISGGLGIAESITTETRSQMMYDLTVEEVHTFAVGDGAWVVHNQQRPFMPPPGTLFDIAPGVGEHLSKFSSSFSNPFAYSWQEWPDYLIRLPNMKLNQSSSNTIMRLADSDIARYSLPIILNRIANEEVPGTTIRFNIQDLTKNMSLTILELTRIQNNTTLMRMTKYYNGIGNELIGDELDIMLNNLCG